MPRLLADTHIILRWVSEPRRLSTRQFRTLEDCLRKGEPIGVSAISLIELAHLLRAGQARSSGDPDAVLHLLEQGEAFQILPITVSIAREFGHTFPALLDPSDAIIAATARVHNCRLVTSDQRIIESNVVPTVE